VKKVLKKNEKKKNERIDTKDNFKYKIDIQNKNNIDIKNDKLLRSIDI